MYGSQNQFLGKNMRRKTTIVKIGNLSLSSEEPVMIQSMLNTSTMDTEACVEQAIRIIDAGGRLVRITAQGVKEAENLKNIRAALCERIFILILPQPLWQHGMLKKCVLIPVILRINGLLLSNWSIRMISMPQNWRY